MRSPSARTIPLAALLAAACSSSSPASPRDAATDAKSTSDGTSGDGSCGGSIACTGSLQGDVSGSITSCTVSNQTGLSLGFGEVTFHFTVTDAATGVAVTGTGNVSTTGSFAAGGYSVDAGLWNDAMGVAADSLWTIAWTGDAGPTMTQCNGVSSPDATPSICAGAALTVTGIDACGFVHGTFDVTVPSYMGSAMVGVSLAF